MSRDLTHALDQANRVLTELATRAPAVFDRDQRGGDNERDGYPSGGVGNGGRSADRTSSTERVGTERADPEKGGDRADPLHAITTGITRDLDQAVKALQAAISKVALAEHMANPDGRSNPPTHCAACARLVMCTSVDPIRSGYCDACRKAWQRYKAELAEQGINADRAFFEAQRKKEPAA